MIYSNQQLSSKFYQIINITRLNIASIPKRYGQSLVIIIGIGGVVAVLVTLLAMVNGFNATLRGAGQDDRAIILRSGSTSEINGSISFEQSNIIADKAGIQTNAQGPLAATESYVSIYIKKRLSGNIANVAFRGISAQSLLLRPEVDIISGRNIEFGKFEVIVGRNAADQFQGLSIGSSINVRNTQWKIVGLFTAGTSVFDSEIWTDAEILNGVFNRTNRFSSMLVRLQSSQHLELLQTALSDDPRLNHSVHRETDFYAAQAMNTALLIKGVGVTVFSIMAIGAFFAALNTMYASVYSRRIEIATLRALGFGNSAIVISVMVESLLLALIGGTIGALLSFAIFNGYTASTIGTNTQVSFNFIVSIDLLISGILAALTLGLVGGLLPAISASRLSISAILGRR